MTIMVENAVFSQEVEIHRNEVKLLEANNAQVEADIR